MRTISRLIATSTAAALIFCASMAMTATAASADTASAAQDVVRFLANERAHAGAPAIPVVLDPALSAIMANSCDDPINYANSAGNGGFAISICVPPPSLSPGQSGQAVAEFMLSPAHAVPILQLHATKILLGVACDSQGQLHVGGVIVDPVFDDTAASTPYPPATPQHSGASCSEPAPPTTPAAPLATQPPASRGGGTPTQSPSMGDGGSAPQPSGGDTPTSASPVVSTTTHNGAVTVTRQDGNKTTTAANGTVTTSLPNGTKVIKSKDGTVTFISKDGTKTIVTKEGHRTVVRPGDATTTTAPTSTAPSHVKPIASKAPSQPSHRVSQSRIPAWVWIAAGIAALAIVATAVWLTMRSRRSGVAE